MKIRCRKWHLPICAVLKEFAIVFAVVLENFVVLSLILYTISESHTLSYLRNHTVFNMFAIVLTIFLETIFFSRWFFIWSQGNFCYWRWRRFHHALRNQRWSSAISFFGRPYRHLERHATNQDSYMGFYIRESSFRKIWFHFLRGRRSIENVSIGMGHG